MKDYLVYEGNYMKLASAALGIPSLVESDNDEIKFWAQIMADIPRTRYLPTQQHSILDIQKNIIKLMEENNEGIFNYTQGTWDSKSFIATKLLHSLLERRANHDTRDSELLGDLHFAYIDDHKRNCGLSISYLRDCDDEAKIDSSEIEEKDRKYTFQICVTRNTTSQPEKKRDTLCHKS